MPSRLSPTPKRKVFFGVAIEDAATLLVELQEVVLVAVSLALLTFVPNPSLSQEL